MQHTLIYYECFIKKKLKIAITQNYVYLFSADSIRGGQGLFLQRAVTVPDLSSRRKISLVLIIPRFAKTVDTELSFKLRKFFLLFFFF